MRPTLLAFAAAPAFALVQPSFAADPVSLSARFEEGQTMRYAIDLDASITQKQDEQMPFNQRVKQTIVLDLEVVTVDERGAVLDGKVSSLHVGALWGNRMHAYEWPKVTTDVPLRLPPVIILEQVGELARDVRVRARVNLPSSDEAGSVVVSGFEGVVKGLDEQDVFDETVLGLLANQQMSDALAGAFFVEGVSSPVRPGTGWETTDRINLGPAGAIDVTTSWVFSSLDNGEATVRGTPRMTVARPAAADPASPTVSLEVEEASIAVAWNASAGRADERTSTQALTTVWTLGPMTLTQQQNTTLKVTRKD
ncbi:MAG: hypothetical protein ACTS27_08020 [Phycisphaerales bacterium]